MSRLKSYWINIFAKRHNCRRGYKGFQLRRFFHGLINRNNGLSSSFSSQYWRMSWLVYKSLMFRPANLMLIGSQAALFSVIPTPQFIQRAKNNEVDSENFQEVFESKLTGGKDTIERDSIDKKIDDLVMQKTVEEVLEMVDIDKKMDELILAEEVAKESKRIHQSDENLVNKDIDSFSMMNYTGFESTVDSLKAENSFNKHKFKITEAMLNLTPLKSVEELDSFSKYLENLQYNDRVVLNKETQIGQKIAFQLKDFFFMYNLAQSLELTDFNSVETEKDFFWKNNRQLGAFKDLQYCKIEEPTKQDLLHMRKEKKLQKESTKKNKTQITMDDDENITFSKGNIEAYVYNETAKSGWFFRTWRHYQSKNMLTWEQFWKRSNDIDILIKQSGNKFLYNNIIEYLNKFRNTGIQETSQIIKIYDLIPQNDLCLKEAFTRWILVNEKSLQHILQKKNSCNSNVLIRNEPLVINMIDSIMKGESYKPNERWESLLRFLKCINIKSKVDEAPKRIKKKPFIRSFTIVRPFQGVNSSNKKQLLNQKRMDVSLPIFVKLLEKTIELEKQTQSLRLINCMKSGIKTINNEKSNNVKEEEILIDLTSYFYKVNEISSTDTWLRYDDNLTDIAELKQRSTHNSDENTKEKQTLVKVVCANKAFKKCIEHMKESTYM